MIYTNSAAKTAKNNGLTVISSKLIADFSELRNAVENTTSNTIFNSDELYTAATVAFTDIFSKRDISSNSEYAEFFTNKYRICIDITFNVINVYDANGYKRKYKHITVDAAKITVYGEYNNQVLTYLHNGDKFYTYKASEDAYIA